MHSLYRSSTRGPEDDSVESKHVAPISHYVFNITSVVKGEYLVRNTTNIRTDGIFYDLKLHVSALEISISIP